MQARKELENIKENYTRFSNLCAKYLDNTTSPKLSNSPILEKKTKINTVMEIISSYDALNKTIANFSNNYLNINKLKNDSDKVFFIEAYELFGNFYSTAKNIFYNFAITQTSPDTKNVPDIRSIENEILTIIKYKNAVKLLSFQDGKEKDKEHSLSTQHQSKNYFQSTMSVSAASTNEHKPYIQDLISEPFLSTHLKDRIKKVSNNADRYLSPEEYYLILSCELNAISIRDENKKRDRRILNKYIAKYKKDKSLFLPLDWPFRNKMCKLAINLLNAANDERFTTITENQLGVKDEIDKEIKFFDETAYQLIQCDNLTDLKNLKVKIRKWNSYQRKSKDKINIEEIDFTDNAITILYGIPQYRINTKPDADIKLNLDDMASAFNQFNEKHTPLHEMGLKLLNKFSNNSSQSNEILNARLCAIYVAMSNSKKSTDKALAKKLMPHFPINLIEKFRRENTAVMLTQRCLAELDILKTRSTSKNPLINELEEILNDPTKAAELTVTDLDIILERVRTQLKNDEWVSFDIPISFLGRRLTASDPLKCFIDDFRGNLAEAGYKRIRDDVYHLIKRYIARLEVLETNNDEKRNFLIEHLQKELKKSPTNATSLHDLLDKVSDGLKSASDIGSFFSRHRLRDCVDSFRADLNVIAPRKKSKSKIKSSSSSPAASPFTTRNGSTNSGK